MHNQNQKALNALLALAMAFGYMLIFAYNNTPLGAAVGSDNAMYLTLGTALAKNGVPFEMHIFPHGPHGLGLAENAPDVAQWTGLCRRWLRGLGYAQQLQTE